MIKRLINKYKALPVSAKAAGWFLVCSIVQNGARFLTMPFLVRMLTAEDYGIYSVFISWTNILINITTLNMGYAVVNNAMLKYPDRRAEYVSAAQSISIASTVVVFAVYVVFGRLLNPIIGLPVEYIITIFVMLLFYESFIIQTSRQRYEYKYIHFTIATAAYSVVYMVIPLIAGYIAPQEKRLSAVIYGGAAVQFLFGLGFTLYNYFKGKTFFNKEFWAFALKFNLPLIPHYLSSIVLGESDRIMIRNIIGSAQAGIYAFIYMISIIMNIVSQAVSGALVPQLYNSLKKRDVKQIRSVVNLLLAVFGGMILVFTAVAPEFIKVFATPEYYEGIKLVPVIALSTYFTFLYGFFVNVEYYCEKSVFVAIASVVTAASNVALNALLIPIFGYYAAGYTTLFCYILYSLIHYVFMRLVCKKNLDGLRVYDDKAILLISMGVVLAIVVMMLIYDYLILRYAVLVGLLAAALINRKKLAAKLSQVREKKI